MPGLMPRSARGRSRRRTLSVRARGAQTTSATGSAMIAAVTSRSAILPATSLHVVYRRTVQAGCDRHAAGGSRWHGGATPRRQYAGQDYERDEMTVRKFLEFPLG